MPPQQYLAKVKQGMSSRDAMSAAYPGGNPGQGSAARMPGSSFPPGGDRKPMLPPGAPGQQGGAKGSAVQQVLQAGQKVIQMAAQLGILDQLKQMIAQAGGKPGGGPPGLASGAPGVRAPMGGGPPAGGGPPGMV